MADQIQILSRQYLRMYPLKDITWKHAVNHLLSLNYGEAMDFQQQLLQNTIQHPLAKKYPPTLKYSRLFIKNLIMQIEEHNHEVNEDLYAVHAELLSPTSSSTSDGSSYCFKTYCLEGDLTVTLKETLNIISEGTTGMFTWEASHVLSNWCSKECDRFCGKDILELGAGLGMTGLSVIKSCNPVSYTFTDSHSSVIKTLKENISINFEDENLQKLNHSDEDIANCIDGMMEDDFRLSYKGTSVSVRRLDWTSDSCDVCYDVILAADVVYDPEIIPSLVDTIKEVLSKKAGAVAYVASTIRNLETFSFFKSTLAIKGVKLCSESPHTYRQSPSQPESSVIIMHLSL